LILQSPSTELLMRDYQTKVRFRSAITGHTISPCKREALRAGPFFSLSRAEWKRREWISTASFGRTLAPDVKEVVNRVIIAPQFLEHAREAVAPGTTLVITDLPVSSQTRSGPGFNILTTD
jgi:hypothetical protein